MQGRRPGEGCTEKDAPRGRRCVVEMGRDQLQALCWA